MDLSEILHRHHQQIVDVWLHRMISDRSSRYSEESEDDLRVLVARAAVSFRLALVDDQWSELRKFVGFIVRKRLQAGFRVSEVQRAFELYRETIIPLLVAHIEPSSLTEVLLRVHHCLVSTVTHFSTYFQNLHEQFLKNQARYLEQEIAKRTKELAESERKYKILVEDINDGYFVLVEGTIVFANNAFSNMHGYDLREVLGSDYLDFVAPESRTRVETAYGTSEYGPPNPSRIEYMRLHRDGSHLPTEIMAKISSYGGQVANIGICRDISERVQLERKTREAEKLNALTQLAASLAHEIRNPLTAIKMNVQMLSESPWPQKDDRKLIESTLGGVEQITRAVMEMMDLTVPFRLRQQWVDTRSLLDGCLRIISQRMKYQGVTASMRLCSELKEMFVDPARIEQAVVNLLLNALEVLPRGGRIFLSTRIVQDNGRGWGEIRIGDNGPGVPKEKLPYLFDPFHSEKAGGIGLGLANVKKIVGAHGGEVVVTPRKPTGVSFRLRMPQK